MRAFSADSWASCLLSLHVLTDLWNMTIICVQCSVASVTSSSVAYLHSSVMVHWPQWWAWLGGCDTHWHQQRWFSNKFELGLYVSSFMRGMLDRAVANAGSVRLSVRHTRRPRLNGSRYRNALGTTWYNDVSSLLSRGQISWSWV